jgi:hypothetical protein
VASRNPPLRRGRKSAFPRVIPRFVLASASPRRRQLLKKAGYEFEIISPPGDEVSHPWLTIRELTVGNATRKARRVAQISHTGQHRWLRRWETCRC